MSGENVTNRHFVVAGMTCLNCQARIERALRRTEGVSSASVDYRSGEGAVVYDPEVTDFDRLKTVIDELGYEVTEDDPARQAAIRTASLTVIIVALYVLLQRFGVLTLLVPSRLADSGMGYGTLFVTGLLTSVHCIAMCGGINLSQSVPMGVEAGRRAYLPAVLYNLGRVISYAVIGGVLGGLGYLIGGGTGAGVPVLLQGILKLIAGVLMVVMGVNMLGLFPGLRRLSIQMPRIRFGRNRGPFVVGLLNGLMPCGPLQSIQIVALASGSPVTGALSMLVFSLGTVPLMLGLGSLVTALGQKFSRGVMQVGAVLVAVLGLAMLSQGCSLTGMISQKQLLLCVAVLAAAGVVLTLPLANRKIRYAALAGGVLLVVGAGMLLQDGRVRDTVTQAMLQDGVQVAYSTLSPGGYPSIRVKEGVPVRWVITAPEGSVNGCNYKLFIQAYDLEHEFHEGENVIEFTPTESGTVPFSCWMGMLQGNIYIEES